MSSMNRRSSVSSSSSVPASSTLAKRPAVENATKVAAAASEQAKKRVALGNITNQSNTGRSASRLPGTKGVHRGSTTSSKLNVKKGSVTCVRDKNLPRSSVTASAATISCKDVSLTLHDGPTYAAGEPCSTVISPNRSGDSVSLDETMSPCESMRSPDFEYIDNGDSSAITSLERRAIKNFHISDHANAAGSVWKRDVPVLMETDDIFDVDNNHKDPQLCATLAPDIYKHLRTAETEKRPAADFMERIQKDINASMRAILVDWLVEVAEEYRLVPDTLYLTVNYIDRYLSGNEMNRQRLQLLGVACMLIAAKYEEICAPQVEEFCYITDNTYFKDEVLQMEAAVLKYLKFEMTAPTAKCFLRSYNLCFIHHNMYLCFANSCVELMIFLLFTKGDLSVLLKDVMRYLCFHYFHQRFRVTLYSLLCKLFRPFCFSLSISLFQVPLLQLEFLANYVAELSLLEYNMLCYSPSLIAASAIFLAKFILQPMKKPWNATLGHYTIYKPSELCDCVKALHHLFHSSPGSSLPAIREKYSQHKYKFVAKKYCPPSIPSKFFQDPIN